jgi:hypothetical protein
MDELILDSMIAEPILLRNRQSEAAKSIEKSPNRKSPNVRRA